MGIPYSNSFSYNNTFKSFNEELWNKLAKALKEVDPQKIVFAVEISINLWENNCHFLNKEVLSF